jgi:hypothetical protein
MMAAGRSHRLQGPGGFEGVPRSESSGALSSPAAEQRERAERPGIRLRGETDVASIILRALDLHGGSGEPGYDSS